MLASGADVGLAFDGDADRVFLVDEKAAPVSGSLTTALVAKAMLEKHPGSTVLYNLICSKVVPETIAEQRRHARPHPGGPLLHQAGDGRHRGRLRGRALGPLLLPGQLPGRLGPHRRAGHPRGAVGGGRAAVGVAGARSGATPTRARSTPKVRRPRRSGGGAGRALRRRAGVDSTAPTASPSTSATGGSTCAPRTPSRCCA